VTTNDQLLGLFDQTMNVGGPVGSTIPQAPATSWVELRTRAQFDSSLRERYTIRSWLNAAGKLYSQVG
jgi:hypothetical protein